MQKFRKRDDPRKSLTTLNPPPSKLFPLGEADRTTDSQQVVRKASRQKSSARKASAREPGAGSLREKNIRSHRQKNIIIKIIIVVICVCVYVCVHIHIYIYIERERSNNNANNYNNEINNEHANKHN